MQNFSTNDDLFDIYYDVYESLFDRIRELMDEQTDTETLKMMRGHVIQAVAAMENTTPESVYRELEGIRDDTKALLLQP